MSDDEADIDTAGADEPDFNTFSEGADTSPKSAKKPIRRASAVLIAVLVSGAIGWLGAVFLGGGLKTTKALQTRFASVETEIALGKAGRDALAREIESLRAQISAQQKQTRTYADSLADVSSKLDTLSKNETLAQITARLDVLEVIGDVDREGTSVLPARFQPLEDGIDEIATVNPAGNFPAFSKPGAGPVNLPTAKAGETGADALAFLIDTFPRQRMLEAVHAQKVALADEKPSWLRRGLGKLVKVRNTDQPDPVATINAAETALSLGQVDDAVKLVNTLNPPVKAMAADWIGAARKARASPEEE